MRYIYQSEVQDGRDNFVAGASVTVTRAGGTTKASIYSALTGGTVDSDGIITTGTDGTFAFYVDEDDYSHSQQFRIVWSKSGFTSETWDYIQIFPDGDRTLLTSSTVDQGDANIVGTLAWHVADASTDPATVTVLPGTYKITTNIVVATTMNLNIKKGIFKPDASKTLTIESPGHIICGQDQQIVDLTNNSTNPLLFADGGIVYPEWWGAYNDSTNGDTTADALQACITSLASVSYGAEIKLNGEYLSDTQLTIAFSGLKISGTGDFYTRILFTGCSGILINQVHNITLQGFEIAAGVRHTVTPNAYLGLDIAGVTGTRPTNIIIRDVYIDGFLTAIESNWIGSSVFDNVSTNYGHTGLLALGISINNVVTNCSFVGDGVAGGIGISFNDTTNASEGWMIDNTLVYNNQYGIYGVGMSFVYIANCILDYNSGYGVYIGDTGSASLDWVITGNYISMSGAATAGVGIDDGTAHSQRAGHKITDNKFIVYSGETCTNGIITIDDEVKNTVISGNSFVGFATYDIRISDNDTGSTIITNNQCISSGPTYNIYAPAGGLIANNIGTVSGLEDLTYVKIGNTKHTYAVAAPESGAWIRGDICWNIEPSAGGTVGWVCTTAGSPGTWKIFGGAIEA